MNQAFTYNFPAIRGKQAGKEYYVAMCPLGIIPKLFIFDEDDLPAKYRAQRVLNKTRIPDITNYIVENKSDYVFSSLTASVDGEVEFSEITNQQGHQNIGVLSISLDAKFLINDGQHRRAAIEEALIIEPDLANETISVVFYVDRDLKKAQQIFSDLNRHAVNTTSSIGILYDHRDKMAIITRELVESNDFLKRYTDTERVNLSKYSPKVLALNHIFNTNLRICGKKKGDEITDQEITFIKNFWTELTKSIPEWDLVMKKQLSPKDLRANYIVGHGVFLESIGIIGNYILKNHPEKLKEIMAGLVTIDWSRTNVELWQNRAFSENGRIHKSSLTITLTANQIKRLLSLNLTANEEKQEIAFKKGS